jgi:hypothetical protein
MGEGFSAPGGAEPDGSFLQYDKNGFLTLGSFVSNFINDAAAFHERSDLEQSLNAWNFDDGFVDIFWDEGKISSYSGISVSTGADGGITLSQSTSTASRPSDNNSKDSETGFKGVIINPNSDLTKIEITLSQFTTGVTRVLVNGSEFKTFNSKSSGDTITLERNFSAGTDYFIEVDAEGGNYNLGWYTSGGYPYSSSEVDIVGGTENNFEVSDAYAIKSVKGYGAYGSSGTLTHVRKNLGSTPSKLVASPDYSLNGQSADLIVRDNSGNSITLTPSDFESEQPVSFQDGDIQAEWDLSGDGSGSPEINKTKLLGV